MGNWNRLHLVTILLAVGLLFAAGPVLAQHHDDAPAAAAGEHETVQAADGEHAGNAHGEGAEAGEGEEHGGGHGDIPHLLSLVGWANLLFFTDEHGQVSRTGEMLEAWVDPIFSIIVTAIIVLVFAGVYRRLSVREPGRLQMAIELIFGGLYGLFETILGPTARRYTPYLGTLFIFIICNNLFGIVPLAHSSTSSFANTTFALGICTFLYVQGIAIKENGPLGYLHHMAGSPKTGMDWGFSILLFPLHLLGEFIKPISLSLRLFGNIFGEDTLIAAMVGLGGGLFAFLGLKWLPGLPLQFPFYFLAMLGSTIQALVFTLLSTVYIALMLPHEEHHGGGEAAHGH